MALFPGATYAVIDGVLAYDLHETLGTDLCTCLSWTEI